MMKILFCDVDGTLTRTISGNNFKLHPDDVKPIDGVCDLLWKYKEENWQIVGVSNQGGIASGFKTLDATIEEMQFTLSLLPSLSFILFCPDFHGKECWRVNLTTSQDVGSVKPELAGMFRKPNAGMLVLAKFLLNAEDGVIDTLMVGDRQEDLKCAENIRCPFLWAETWLQGLN
jgi:D-glycero-D-manno-heptose 1,7-bisphosphate phosphatase